MIDAHTRTHTCTHTLYNPPLIPHLDCDNYIPPFSSTYRGASAFVSPEQVRCKKGDKMVLSMRRAEDIGGGGMVMKAEEEGGTRGDGGGYMVWQSQALMVRGGWEWIGKGVV